MKEYLIGLGIDGEKLFKNFKDTLGFLEQVESQSGEAGKAIDEAFGKGSKASEEFDAKLKNTSKNLETIRELGKVAGKEMAEALSGKNINTSEFEKKMDSFKKKLSDLTAKVDIELDENKLIAFQRQIENAKDDIDQLNVALNMSKEIMSSMDTNSEEYQQLAEAIAYCESAMQEFEQQVQANQEAEEALTQSAHGLGATFEQVYGELQPLSTRLGEIEDRLYEMKLAGQENTEEFQALRDEAIRFRQTIQEVDASVDNFAKSSGKIDALVEGATGLVGAFTAVQGVTALLGSENEELEKALLKVNGAMAVLQGLQAVASVLNKESAFSVMFLRNTQVQSNLTTAQAIALRSALTTATNVETLATEALTVAQYNATVATSAVALASEAHALANTEETASALASATATEAETIAMVANAETTLASATASRVNASANLAQATAMNTATVASKILKFALASIGIGLIIIAVSLLVEYWDDLTASAKKFLPVGESIGKTFDKIKSYALGVGNAILQFVIAPLKALYTLIDSGDIDKALKSYADSLDVVSNFNAGFQMNEARNAEKYRNEQEQKNIDFAKRELERRKNRGEDVYQLEQRLLARQMALNRKTNESNEELQKEYEDAKDKRFAEDAKKTEERRKKAEEDAKKRAEDARKKAEEEAKKNRDLTIKYAEEISKLEIDAMDEGLEKKLALIENERKLREEAIIREGASSAEAIQKQQELIQDLNEQAERKKNEAIQESAIERIKLEAEANKELALLKKENLESDLDLLNLETQASLDAINERYSKEEALRLQLIEATEKNRAEREKEIKAKYFNESLKTEEERALLGIELSSQYADKSVETERQKQIALLTVQLYYAELALNNIVDDGTEESRLRKQQAQLVVKQLKEGLEEATNGGEYKFDFLTFLGLDKGMSSQDQQKLRGAVNESVKILSDFTQFMIDNYQEQIDAKQEQIDQSQEEIDTLEDQLEEEKDLRDAGLANNVENIEAQIAEKQREQDELKRQQDEALEQKKKAQKVQLAIDTATQLSALITSSINVIQGFSTIPIIGVPLGIAMVALMTGAFIAQKAKAYQAVNQQQTTQYRHGGEIKGRSHSQGGEKYYNEDGSVVKELEEGEFVVKKEQYGKFGKLVRAINDNDFSKLSVNDYAVAEMFRLLGFDFDTGMDEVKNLQLSLMTLGYSASESQHLAEISKGIAQLVESDKNTPKSYELDGFMCTRIGNVVKKRPLNLKPNKDDENAE